MTRRSFPNTAFCRIPFCRNTNSGTATANTKTGNRGRSFKGGDFTATWGIHFRIADEILKHLHQIDREYFIIGNIAPDCGKRVENGYDPPTEVTHLTKMWNKSDCNCEFIFENCIKDETEFKKKSFVAGYYTHLLTDRLYSRLISMPIEEEFGKYREHPGFSKLVKREWYDADFKFFAENKSPAFEDFKRYRAFKEAYPSIYKHGEIGKQMKYIVRFYKNKKPENVAFLYTNKQDFDHFVAKASEIILEEMHKNGMIKLFN